jgi:hypothetical protein
MNETCPRCGAVKWAVTPDGNDECTTCGYVEDECPHGYPLNDVNCCPGCTAAARRDGAA